MISIEILVVFLIFLNPIMSTNNAEPNVQPAPNAHQNKPPTGIANGLWQGSSNAFGIAKKAVGTVASYLQPTSTPIYGYLEYMFKPEEIHQKNLQKLAKGKRPLPFPPFPPIGFHIIPREKYQQLLKVHTDRKLTASQKFAAIDDILFTLDDKILEKLPVPMPFGHPGLSEKMRKKFHEVFAKKIDYMKKHAEAGKIFMELNSEEKKLTREPVLNELLFHEHWQEGTEILKQIDEINWDPENTPEMIWDKFWEVIDGMDDEKFKAFKQKVEYAVNPAKWSLVPFAIMTFIGRLQQTFNYFFAYG